MFPEHQKGPHRDWKREVEFLDNIFKDGAAYTVGKVNGDHWLLYMASQIRTITSLSNSQILDYDSLPNLQAVPDYTIEILMSDLGKESRDSFFFSQKLASKSPSNLALDISHQLGINTIFPSQLTSLDAYAFTPCGYSSNALIKWVNAEYPNMPTVSNSGEGYFTIHVTPEEGWSYASFECNVPLASSHDEKDPRAMPSIEMLVKRVVSIFRPGRITLTLFMSNQNDDRRNCAAEDAQGAFRAALNCIQSGEEADPIRYRRTDKINYEFSHYDLVFASFEVMVWRPGGKGACNLWK